MHRIRIDGALTPTLTLEDWAVSRSRMSQLRESSQIARQPSPGARVARDYGWRAASIELSAKVVHRSSTGAEVDVHQLRNRLRQLATLSSLGRLSRLVTMKLVMSDVGIAERKARLCEHQRSVPGIG